MPHDEQPGPGSPADWYPDPNVRGTMRYWDGTGWTDHTADGYDDGPSRRSTVHDPYQRIARPKAGFVELNRMALISLGVSAAFFLVAQLSNVHLLGIIPLLTGYRSYQAREQLAPVALAVAVASLVLALAT